MDEINYKPKKNLNKNKLIKEILIQDKSESYEDEAISFQQKSKSGNINFKNSTIENNIINELSFDLNINKSSDFHINNSLNLGECKNGEINYKCLNNNIDINNENEEINSWNFNMSPSEIFNIDNQTNKKNNYENYKLNNNHIKSYVNNVINLNKIMMNCFIIISTKNLI